MRYAEGQEREKDGPSTQIFCTVQLFMFLRKLAGASAVFLAMAMLDWAGFHEGAEQGEGVKLTIRVLTSFVPAAMLLLGVWIAMGYPLSRARHAEILQELDARAVRQAGSP